MELQQVYTNKLAGKLMVMGFPLISIGSKPKDNGRFYNIYYFKKSEQLRLAIDELTKE